MAHLAVPIFVSLALALASCAADDALAAPVVSIVSMEDRSGINQSELMLLQIHSVAITTETRPSVQEMSLLGTRSGSGSLNALSAQALRKMRTERTNKLARALRANKQLANLNQRLEADIQSIKRAQVEASSEADAIVSNSKEILLGTCQMSEATKRAASEASKDDDGKDVGGENPVASPSDQDEEETEDQEHFSIGEENDSPTDSANSPVALIQLWQGNASKASYVKDLERLEMASRRVDVQRQKLLSHRQILNSTMISLLSNRSDMKAALRSLKEKVIDLRVFARRLHQLSDTRNMSWDIVQDQQNILRQNITQQLEEAEKSWRESITVTKRLRELGVESGIAGEGKPAFLAYGDESDNAAITAMRADLDSLQTSNRKEPSASAVAQTSMMMRTLATLQINPRCTEELQSTIEERATHLALLNLDEQAQDARARMEQELNTLDREEVMLRRLENNGQLAMVNANLSVEVTTLQQKTAVLWREVTPEHSAPSSGEESQFDTCADSTTLRRLQEQEHNATGLMEKHVNIQQDIQSMFRLSETVAGPRRHKALMRQREVLLQARMLLQKVEAGLEEEVRKCQHKQANPVQEVTRQVETLLEVDHMVEDDAEDREIEQELKEEEHRVAEELARDIDEKKKHDDDEKEADEQAKREAEGVLTQALTQASEIEGAAKKEYDGHMEEESANDKATQLDTSDVLENSNEGDRVEKYIATLLQENVERKANAELLQKHSSASNVPSHGDEADLREEKIGIQASMAHTRDDHGPAAVRVRPTTPMVEGSKAVSAAESSTPSPVSVPTPKWDKVKPVWETIGAAGMFHSSAAWQVQTFLFAGGIIVFLLCIVLFQSANSATLGPTSDKPEAIRPMSLLDSALATLMPTRSSRSSTIKLPASRTRFYSGNGAPPFSEASDTATVAAAKRQPVANSNSTPFSPSLSADATAGTASSPHPSASNALWAVNTRSTAPNGATMQSPSRKPFVPRLALESALEALPMVKQHSLGSATSTTEPAGVAQQGLASACSLRANLANRNCGAAGIANHCPGHDCSSYSDCDERMSEASDDSCSCPSESSIMIQYEALDFQKTAAPHSPTRTH